MARAHLLLRALAAAAIAIFLSGTAKAAEQPDFAAFLGGVREEALARGIAAATLDAALLDFQPIPRVIELDRKQPEFTLTFDEYMARVASPERAAKGRMKYEENRVLLDQIGQKYGVHPRFVVALWGIETDFGRVTGGFSVVPALATLAYDGRRSAYFRGELMNALQILDAGHIQPQAMVGSWAGAMGQCQFMPSSFLKFARDHDGDGRIDIWNSRADVLASAANYLGSSGWKSDEGWGRPVRLPPAFDAAMLGLETKKPLAEWQALGIRKADGTALPTRDIEASVVLAEPAKGVDGGRAFLVYDNFRTIMKWNRSTFFALAAGHLADRIGAQ